MRYVCYKKTVSKVADEEIKDVPSIKILLTTLFESEMTCALKLESGLSHDQVRITELGETSFKYTVFNSNAKLRKTSGYKEITYLEIVTVDNILSGLKPGIDRWSLLDAEEFDGD